MAKTVGNFSRRAQSSIDKVPNVGNRLTTSNQICQHVVVTGGGAAAAVVVVAAAVAVAVLLFIMLLLLLLVVLVRNAVNKKY